MFDIAWCDKFDISIYVSTQLYSRKTFTAPTFIKKEIFVTFYITIRMCDDI